MGLKAAIFRGILGLVEVVLKVLTLLQEGLQALLQEVSGVGDQGLVLFWF